MTYLAADAGTSTVHLTLPNWVWWGLVTSVFVTVVYLVLSWALASAWSSMTGGWLGTTSDMFTLTPKVLVLIYATYGLIPSFILTGVWASGHEFLGIILGVVAFCAVQYGWRLLNR